MTKSIRKSTLVGAGIIAVACAIVLWAASAFALPYTHSDEEADAGSGLVHIAVTVDNSAIGGFTKCVWLPVNSDDANVEAVFNEYLTASESKVDRFAHEDYNMQSLAKYLSGHEYTVSVYAAGGQKPGAEPKYTSNSIGGENYSGLQTGDAVYVTVTK